MTAHARTVPGINTFWLLRITGSACLMTLALVVVTLVIGKLLPEQMQVAYESTTLGIPQQRQVYLMDVQRTLLARLTDETDNILSMNWSPDGTRVAYVSARPGAPARLYVLDVDRRHSIPMPDNILPISNTIYWSPDGHALAFMASSNGRGRIGVFSVDDYIMRVMDIGNSNLYAVPEWASDSQTLLYMAYLTGTNESGRPALLAVPVACAESRSCAKSSVHLLPQYNVYAFSWSPDGTMLIFSGVTPTTEGVFSTKLTCADVTQGCFSEPELLWATSTHSRPVMSPDGSNIALRENTNTITIIDVLTRDARQLTTGAAIKDNVVWGTDGNAIVYEAYTRVTADLFEINPLTGEERQLTTSVNEDLRPRVRPDQ